MLIKKLIWDKWNRVHITKHSVTTKEVDEVCQGRHQTIESYRGRIQLTGKTSNGRLLVVILSPEDRDLQQYEDGCYYPITAFEEQE